MDCGIPNLNSNLNLVVIFQAKSLYSKERTNCQLKFIQQIFFDNFEQWLPNFQVQDNELLVVPTATVTQEQVTPSEQFFFELQKKLTDYYINFQTNIQMKNCFL